MFETPPELSGVRHDFVPVDGRDVHVAQAGPDGAPALLLVHGWPQHWWTWRKVIPAVAATHRVIAPDLPGYGWSEPASSYEKAHLAEGLLHLLDALAIDRVTWIGHDWGGWVGYLAALRAPERIERMLTVAIPHPWMGTSPRQVLALLSYQVPVSLPGAGPRLADPLVRRILQVGRGSDRLDPATVDLFAARIPPAVTVATYRTFLSRELPALRRGALADARLAVPTRAIIGGADVVGHGARPGPVPGQPELTVEILEAASHWIPELQPDAITGWIAAGG